MTAKQRGRPKVTSDDCQRDTIVDTARRLFVKRGYGLTTTEDITVGCKISKQTLYRHFPAKTALFAAVIESYSHIWLDLPCAGEDLPLAEALMKIFRVDISEEADRERFDAIRLFIVETHGNPELRAMLKCHGHEVSRAALAEWLECQQQRGRIRPGNSPGLAQMLMDMVFGATILKHLNDMTFAADDQRRRHVQSCVDVFLNGVAPHNPNHSTSSRASVNNGTEG